ncbi:MAG TPA: DUF4260 family protein [Candidatus Limnocylindria bacterium]
MKRAAVDLMLRAEQVAILATGIVVWTANGGPWPLLIPAWLLVDLSMIGYLGGPRLGSITYNAAHNLVLPLGLLGVGWWTATGWLVLSASVFLTHIGVDRAFGYGLKLPTDFRDTHLGRIGRG